MVKVNHGWQARPFEEVESLASQAVSPASSAYTVHRAHDSSASPRQPAASAPSHPDSSQDPAAPRPASDSPPLPASAAAKPALAAAALIQPSAPLCRPVVDGRRRSSNAPPAMLSRAPSASPHTPGQPSRPHTRQPSMSRAEQDVAESLLFMSSPGNSANVKHAFSPSLSPSAQQQQQQPPAPPRSTGPRHALPSGPRKAPPSQRPAAPAKKAGGGMPPPAPSPMELNSPQSTNLSPVRGAPRRRAHGPGSHARASLSLSLPRGLGMGQGSARKSLQDEDIERMLDHAGAESPDSSDSEIQLPPGRAGVASAMET